MIGPLILHGSSDEGVFHMFFSQLSLQLKGRLSPLIIVSDEERVFGEGSNLLCTRHLKENLNAYMTDKIGATSAIRREIIEKVFGQDILCKTEEHLELKSMCRKLSSRLESYIMQCTVKGIQKNAATCRHFPQVQINAHNWTNNNAESLNHILKQKTNWRPLQLLQLVQQLQEAVEAQQGNVQRALVSLGDFILDEAFQKFGKTASRWQLMTEKGVTCE